MTSQVMFVTDLWMVVRGDDNGQNFIIREGLTKEGATELAHSLLRGHKQWYSIWEYTPETRADLVALHKLKV